MARTPHEWSSSSSRSRYDVLILDAKLRQSLVAVRSLGRRGMHVAALETENLASIVPTFSSRWCERSFVAPSYKDTPEAFVDYLEQLVNDNDIRVLIPSSDGTLEVLRIYRARLERRAGITLAKEPALGIAINKLQTLELAKELGIGVPAGVYVKTVNEVPAALQEVGLPAVVKPIEPCLWSDGRHGDRVSCRLVTTADEARAGVEALTHLGVTSIIQEFLTGRREAVDLFYANGEIYARFAQWAKRMQPPLGGTSVFRQSIAFPQDIGEQAERLVRAINLEGCSEVEFRRDADGKPYLMEINPRLSASIEVAVRAGVDFPHLLFQWASGERLEPVRGYRVGSWMRYLQGDLLTTIQSVTQRGRPGVTAPGRAISDFLTSFFIPSHYDFVDWSDLRPSYTATWDFARSVLRHLRRSA